jgi:mannose/fructose/N-acetylgalactosamine-specific phosphotransferase system component IIB
MNNEKTKKVYMYIEEREPVQTLYLTDEQAAVFKWIKEQGYEIDVRRIDGKPPEEIVADEYDFDR